MVQWLTCSPFGRCHVRSWRGEAVKHRLPALGRAWNPWLWFTPNFGWLLYQRPKLICWSQWKIWKITWACLIQRWHNSRYLCDATRISLAFAKPLLRTWRWNKDWKIWGPEPCEDCDQPDCTPNCLEKYLEAWWYEWVRSMCHIGIFCL